MNPKDADRLFAIFLHLHTWKELFSTGIGLAIAAKFVERHGRGI